MKIVVFGGSGFLGSHIVDKLTECNHKVYIFDLNPSPYLKSGQEMIVGDILDFDTVKRITKNIDVVYNFAGVSDIDEAKAKPLETIKNNILGNTHILEACKVNRVKRFMFASSIYVYSETGSFYRGSKQACELLIEDYHKEYNLDFTILRYGSLYGPRTDQRNWIYRVLQQALKEKKISREGDGGEIREYIHVYDAARLSIKALDDEFRNQYLMITGQQPMKIKDMMIMIKEMLNNEIQLKFVDIEREGHYEITPYNFRPKLAKRISDSSCVDLGQGILDMLNVLYEQNIKK